MPETPIDLSKKATEQTQKITPFEVEISSEQINYNAVIEDFGSTRIDNALLERFEKLTGQKPHVFLRRGLYFSHREFDKILDLYEQKKPFYIFTGRGPSSGDMHIGHMIPFIFTAYLQRVFDCALVIQINDDEKYFWKDVRLEDLNRVAQENIKEVISFGFNLEKTFIFTNTEYIKEMYLNICRIQKRVTFNQIKGIFGVDTSSNVGKIAFPAVQAAPSFSSSFQKLFGDRKMPCLIVCAIDQDPYFRMTRDVAPRMKETKPALIHCKFVPGLHGVNSKMSASLQNSAIYLGDTPKQVRKKVNASKSGGGETREMHREHGAKLEDDVPYAYLQFFLENDEVMSQVTRQYSSGEMETGEVKKLLIDTLNTLLKDLQDRRKTVNEDTVSAFKAVRRLKGFE